MKNSILSIAAMALLSGNAIAQQKTNIILFLVDDMGWQDTSLPFWNDTTELNHIYETPNMERLAKKGVRFTHAYACPISSPSRVSLFTGASAAQHKVTNWTLKKDTPTDRKRWILKHGIIMVCVLNPGWNILFMRSACHNCFVKMDILP